MPIVFYIIYQDNLLKNSKILSNRGVKALTWLDSILLFRVRRCIRWARATSEVWLDVSEISATVSLQPRKTAYLYLAPMRGESNNHVTAS